MIVGPINGGMILPELTNPGTAADLYPGKQLIDANGNVLTGSMPTQGAQTITPGTTNKTIQSGRFLTGTQTIQGDPDLKAANIKKGVSIFGVTGTMESATYPSLSNPGSASDIRSGRQFIDENGNIVTGTMPTKSAQTYTPGRYAQTIQSGRYLTGNQTIQGDSNLIASNIRSGVEIFGVSGTYEGETTELPGRAYYTGTFYGTTSNVVQFDADSFIDDLYGMMGATYKGIFIMPADLTDYSTMPDGAVCAMIIPPGFTETSPVACAVTTKSSAYKYNVLYDPEGDDDWGFYFAYTDPWHPPSQEIRIALPKRTSMGVYNWGNSSIRYKFVAICDLWTV